VSKRALQTTADARGDSHPTDGAAADAANAVHLIALANDPALLYMLRDALDGRQRVWRVDDVTQAAELLLAAPSSVLFIDAGLTDQETRPLVERLHEQFPGLQLVVTGRRDDEAALSSLISAGAIFRFLHKPASTERVRNFVGAAMRRCAEQPPQPARPPQPAEAPPREPRLALALPRVALDPLMFRRGLRTAASLLAALLLVVAVGLALPQAMPWLQATLPAWTRTNAPAATITPAAAAELMQGLGSAANALGEGRLVEPPGENALDLYRAVLSLDPGNEQAARGIARVADALLAEAEVALFNGDLASAASALDAARSASPIHPHLGVLSEQLALERERSTLAPASPTTLREPVAALPVPTAPQPAGRPTPQVLSDRALAAAREALAQGQTARAAAAIARVNELGVDPEAAARLTVQLDTRRRATERAEHARLLALANQRIAQGWLVEPKADSARHYLDLLRAADPDFDGLADTAALLGARLVGTAWQLADDGRVTEAERVLATAGSVGAPAPDIEAARSAVDAARARTRAATQVLPEASLVRARHVAPAYPPRAAARGVEGWVDLEFTVAADGSTRDAEVIAASPPGVFDEAVLAAVAQWHYVPQVVGGRAVDQRVTARLRFTLDGN